MWFLSLRNVGATVLLAAAVVFYVAGPRSAPNHADALGAGPSTSRNLRDFLDLREAEAWRVLYSEGASATLPISDPPSEVFRAAAELGLPPRGMTESCG